MAKEDLEKIAKLNFSIPEEWREYTNKNPQLIFIPEEARSEDGTVYWRKKGTDTIYRAVKGHKTELYCIVCERQTSLFLSKHQRKLSTGSYNEWVPYCPDCEETPPEFPKSLRIVEDDQKTA